jgi:hypothetical protein
MAEEKKVPYKVISQVTTDIDGKLVDPKSPDAHNIEAELEYEDGRIERVYGTIIKDEKD